MSRQHLKFALGLLLASLSLFEPGSGFGAETVDATIAAAREAAHNNRNAESAKLFAQAIAAAPERRSELLPAYADQLTYSGRSGEAVSLYRETLALHTLSNDSERHVRLAFALALSWSHRLPEALRAYEVVLAKNPQDLEALLGHARVLSWEDQLTPALREYQHILAVDPNNTEALDNIARVENWRGRHRDAGRRANALLAKNEDDTAASLTLAQSELWMGRPDIAARDDSAILRRHPNDVAAKSLALDVADAHTARMQASTTFGTQSDGLSIQSQQLEIEGRSSDGLTSYGVRYQPITYRSQSAGSAIERKLGPFVRRRLNDWSEINGAVFEDDISASGTSGHRFTLYDTYLTLWPSDTLRFDIGSRKETFDNLSSLGQGITAIANTFSFDATPDENTRLTLRGNVGTFSDGNRRAFEQVEFERTALRQPRLSFGLRGTGYTFSRQLNNGYFDPPRYRSAELTTHIYGNVVNRLYYDAAGSYGREWIQDGGTRPSHTLHGALSYVLSHNFSLSTTYDNFDTRQQISNSGFARSVFGVRLQTKW